MDYEIHSHRLGYELFQTDSSRRELWNEITQAIGSVSEEEIIQEFERIQSRGRVKRKSISSVVNHLIKKNLEDLGWRSESRIFVDSEFGDAWRLDFSKSHVSVEVGFNHGSDAAWNVIKPTLASQINHIEKEIQTDVGVIVTATPEMKAAGGFDGAVGTSKTYERILFAMQQVVTVPLVIIGLKAPSTFHIEVVQNRDTSGSIRSTGHVVRH